MHDAYDVCNYMGECVVARNNKLSIGANVCMGLCTRPGRNEKRRRRRQQQQANNDKQQQNAIAAEKLIQKRLAPINYDVMDK